MKNYRITALDIKGKSNTRISSNFQFQYKRVKAQLKTCCTCKLLDFLSFSPVLNNIKNTIKSYMYTKMISIHNF